MRHTRYIATALAAVAAVALLPGGAATATSTKAEKLDCGLELIAQGKPNPSVVHFGFPTCPAPFGKGLHHNTITVTPSSPTSGTITGRFKNYYNPAASAVRSR